MTTRTKKIFGFNLVEITLAIGVIAFGMTSIVTMCVSGMQQSRSAIGESLAATIAENVFGMLTSIGKIDNEWRTGLQLKMEFTSNKAEEMYIGVDEGTPMPYHKTMELPKGPWTGDDKDIYMEYAGSGGGGNNNGMWVCRVFTGEGDDAHVEFAALVRVWMNGSPIKYTYIQRPDNTEGADPEAIVGDVEWDMVPTGGNAGSDANIHSYAGFYVEVSWPISQPLAKRQKRIFYKELVR